MRKNRYLWAVKTVGALVAAGLAVGTFDSAQASDRDGSVLIRYDPPRSVLGPITPRSGLQPVPPRSSVTPAPPPKKPDPIFRPDPFDRRDTFNPPRPPRDRVREKLDELNRGQKANCPLAPVLNRQTGKYEMRRTCK